MTEEIAGILKKRDKRVKIDEQELIALATSRKGDGSSFTHQEIARHLGVTRPAVTRALQRIPKSILASNDVHSFRDNRADIFAEFQRMILTYMTPQKMRDASLNQLGTLFGIVYDKERLEKGQATQHIATVNKSLIDERSMAKIREVISEMTQGQIAAARKQSLALAKRDNENE